MPLRVDLAQLDQSSPFPPLQNEARPTVATRQAAFYVHRQQQTLRKWATYGGPLQPLRINGRLAWRTDDIRKLLEVEGAQ